MNNTKNKNISDPVAIVTGAGGGIGRAVVQGLLDKGLYVAATDLSRDILKDIPVTERLELMEMDVTNRSSITLACEKITSCWGRLDILVNNAGIFRPTPALTMDESTMHRILDVNLQGTLRCTAVFGSVMANQGHGRIINIASISGITGAALGTVYAASKAGMIAATRSAARELAEKGISVNAVAPGYCDTPMLAPEKVMVEKFVVPKIPIKRTAQPEEVAEVVVFLATCKTNYLTGSVLTLDGGISVG